MTETHPHRTALRQAGFSCSKSVPAILAGQLQNVLRHFPEMGQYETETAIISLNPFSKGTYGVLNGLKVTPAAGIQPDIARRNA